MSNRIIKDTIAITVITLVAGLALGVVQDITILRPKSKMSCPQYPNIYPIFSTRYPKEFHGYPTLIPRFSTYLSTSCG